MTNDSAPEQRVDLTPQPRVPTSTELSEREREVFRELTDKWLRPMDVGGRNGSDHSAILTRLVRAGLVERKSRGSDRSFLYRNPAYVEPPLRKTRFDRAMEFVAILASYECAGVDQDPSQDIAEPCGKCGPCEASAFLRKRDKR